MLLYIICSGSFIATPFIMAKDVNRSKIDSRIDEDRGASAISDFKKVKSSRTVYFTPTEYSNLKMGS
jgi:hypothetical protein